MKEVYGLFTVFGDGDGIERFELLSVHTDGDGAETAACNLRAEDPKRYTPIEDIVALNTSREVFEFPYFYMCRLDFSKLLNRVTECGLGYGEFGGFVIEKLSVQ